MTLYRRVKISGILLRPSPLFCKRTDMSYTFRELGVSRGLLHPDNETTELLRRVVFRLPSSSFLLFITSTMYSGLSNNHLGKLYGDLWRVFIKHVSSFKLSDLWDVIVHLYSRFLCVYCMTSLLLYSLNSLHIFT